MSAKAHENLHVLLKRSMSVFISDVNIGNPYNKTLWSFLVFFSPPGSILSCLEVQFWTFVLTLFSQHVHAFLYLL